MKFANYCLLVLFLWSVVTVSAQQLAPLYKVKVASGGYHRLRHDGQGNTYVFGSFDDLGGKNYGRLLKLDASGYLVTGFEKVIADGTILDVAVQPDEKVLISGLFTKVNGQSVPPIIRLNKNGSVDNTFTSALSQRGDIELQSTGKIIVLTTEGLFQRLNPNGSIDPTFNFQNYVFSGSEYEIAPDNSILFANNSIVHKLTPDGADDNSFQIGAGADQSYISALSVQTDGKILVGGFFNKYNGVESKALIRLNANGTVDNSFSAGNQIIGQVFQAVQRANGKILIGGQFTQYGTEYVSLVELNTNGTHSKSIAVVSINNITTIFEGSDGKVTISGEFTAVNGISVFGVCRFNSNYTMDQAFLPKITYNNPNSMGIVVDNAMRATFTGDYAMSGVYSGTSIVKGKVHRVDALGRVDGGFNANLTSGYAFGRGIKSDGKVLVSGGFGNASWELLQLTESGAKDDAFSIGTGSTTNGVSTVIYEIKSFGDLVYLGGSFTHFNGEQSTSLVAVNANGSIAKKFTSLPNLSQVNKIAFQSTGKIILAGYFPFASGDRQLVRLNTDGSLDETFHKLSLLQGPSDIAIDQGDNIYLAGESLRPDGSLLRSLVKLNANGQVDGNFNIGSGFGPWGYLTTVELLPDNKIAVGGYFDTVQGAEQPGFALLNSNGTLLPQQPAFFGKNSVAVDCFYKNGQLFLIGRFTTPDYSDTYALRKILLENVTPPVAPSNVSVTLSNPGALAVTWTHDSPGNYGFVVERAVNSLTEFTAVDTVAANIKTYLDNIKRNDFHTYRVRAVNDGGFSPYSNIDSLKWQPAPEGTVTLSATRQNSPHTVLTWVGSVKYHDGFIIERSTKLTTGYAAIDTVGATVTSYVDEKDAGSAFHYRLVVYNPKGRFTSNTASIVITGIAGKIEQNIKVYPNPAKEHAVVTIDGESLSATIDLVDPYGRTVSSMTNLSAGSHAIDLSSLSRGIYFVKVNAGGVQRISRLVKE